MKKIIHLAAALTFALVLSACGSDANPTSTKAVPSTEENATDIKLVASNWQFDQEEYTVSKGEPINFLLENEAGLHGIKIKELGINLDAGKPGQYIINEAGTYEIECSIQCGSGKEGSHSTMKSKLIVQ